MTTFYSRYQNGERGEVWKELVQFGDIIDPELKNDAMDVCREIVDRSAKNLAILHRRLIDLGYQFANLEKAFVLSTAEDATERLKIEQELGPLPLILQAWYERIHSVDFSQHETQLYGREEIKVNSDPVAGLGSHPVLVVLDLKSCMKFRTALIERVDDPEYLEQISNFFPTGGWASNCDPKGFTLPQYGVDGFFYNDGLGDVSFVDDIRSAFEAGGFPFWQYYLQDRPRTFPVRFPPDYANLRPVLCDQLVPI